MLTALVGAGLPLAGITAQVRTFADPAPPKIHELPAVTTRPPTVYPGLRFVAAPKPLAKAAKTEDWPGLLGARRDGTSRETHLTKSFPADGPALVWSMRRGEGYASPAIVGDRLVFTHREKDQVFIDCLHAQTGRRFWRHSYTCEYRGEYIRNSGPRATPEIRDGRVFVHGVDGRLFCFELTSGRIIWQRDIQQEFHTDDGFFGVVSTPLIHGDLLIQNIGAPQGPCVAAFSCRTGALVWGAGKTWGASCASPTTALVHGQPRIFVLAGGKSRPPTGGLLAIDPATGSLDFEYPFRSRTYESVTASNPLAGDGWVFITSAYGIGSRGLGLKPDGGHRELWRRRNLGLQFSNALHHAGHIYAVDGVSGRVGSIVVVDPRTGKELTRTELLWEDTIEQNGEQRQLDASIGEGSLIYADGAFLCLSDGGHLLWLDATPKGTKILARTWLFSAPESWTPVALSRGLLYVCQNNPERFGKEPPRLLCYDLRGQ